jgi:catechol 2,3-dioxygenase-like lactoylglutathione lyase family enzyme
MPNYKYHHVHLISPDPEKTAEFYARMFGAQKGAAAKTPSGAMSVSLKLNGSSILVGGPRTQPPEYGLNHFGIATDDIEAAVKELKAAGVKFQVEITAIRPGVKIAFFWAPENVLIELVEDKSMF